MNRAWYWASYVLGALSLIGSVAWPLWSDNDLWMLGFSALAGVILMPFVLWPALEAMRAVFSSSNKAKSRRRR